MKRNLLLLVAILAVVAMGLWASLDQGFAQQEADAKFKLATDYYKSANFDLAIQTLTELANEASLQRETKVEVLALLGRAYTAKGYYDQAREALAKLLALEPPLVEFDPDREPPPLMKIYYEVRKSKAGSYAVERPDPGMQTIAILDFKNRSVDDFERFNPMEKGFAELLIGQLNGVIALKVIERERIQWILEEIGLESDPQKFDVGSAVRVGKQLGVHTVLLGSFINARKQMWLGARLVKVETSEVLLTEEIKGKPDDFFDLTERLGKKIAESIQVELPKEPLKVGNATKSLDAMMAYSEGLVFLESGNYQKAYEKFQQALTYDPKYEKARVKSESIKPLIG